MRPIERRVDLDAVQPVRVSHQMTAFVLEDILVFLRDRPSGGPNVNATLTHVLSHIRQQVGARNGNAAGR